MKLFLRVTDYLIEFSKLAFFVVALTADILLAGALLPSDVSNTYIALSILGKLTFLFSTYFSHQISALLGRDKPIKNKFVYQLLFAFWFNWTMFIVFGIAGKQSVPMILGGIFMPVTSYLPTYTFILMCLSLFSIIRSYYKKTGKVSVFAKALSKSAHGAASFFVGETKKNQNTVMPFQEDVAVLIPTHNPGEETENLIQSIIATHPKIKIVLVDDSTPKLSEGAFIINELKDLSIKHPQLVVLRTPKNSLKAGALNYGIEYLLASSTQLEVVITFDDDVAISETTIFDMVKMLYSEKKLGAVCSQVRVLNKNKNILTRLQALEYHNFNISKIADNGFIKGPLVMQGMLTAFRMDALAETGGFTDGHLIEDYDMTAKLKRNGWKVKIAKRAVAWTTVPEGFEGLWKQRVRWTNGGLTVLAQFWKNIPSIYQDLIGHTFFVSLLFLIGISFIFNKTAPKEPIYAPILFALAMTSLVLTFIYNISALATYPDRDKKDIVIKLSLVPELIYGNILSLVLIGTYLFHIFNHVSNKAISVLTKTHNFGLGAFARVGYSTTWGTREI